MLARQGGLTRWAAAVVAVAIASRPSTATFALISSPYSAFQGRDLKCMPHSPRRCPSGAASLTMRKQKASDRRTRRLQRGQVVEEAEETRAVGGVRAFSSRGGTVISDPMATAIWEYKSVDRSKKVRNSFPRKGGSSRSRGRSRKRSAVYSALAAYHAEFLNMLTTEYRAEEAEVLGRIEASIDDPIGLEAGGHALFDMYPERRGNIFTEEIYRFVKANDATTVFPPVGRRGSLKENGNDSAKGDWNGRGYLPPNHSFAASDVIMLTLQVQGSGDFFGTSCLPTNKDAVSVEARVISTGPTYVEVAIPGGAFEAAFGPAPNNVGPRGRGDSKMRIRVDRFFSSVPYNRMVAAIGQITSLPEKRAKQDKKGDASDSVQRQKAQTEICMDEAIREAILSTHGSNDLSSALYQESDACDLGELAKKLAKPPLPNSVHLANQALGYMQTNPHEIFPVFNAPQMNAIGAALTRRLTMIQGPPGTGKTTVAASIAFGFVHQCRNVSPHTKVLACAFSNVGADNLAEQLLRLGLKVMRIGKASGISEALWEHTLDAAIDRDPAAQKALSDATRATANLRSVGRKQAGKKGGSHMKRSYVVNARSGREAATNAVKASIEACNVAATKALRSADVIVCTSVGAADLRLLAACGFVIDEDKVMEEDGKQKAAGRAKKAPDGLPPLSLPFVIVDEACQSVEPANLIPVTSSNSCRSLVMLGDPCQLPPTVKSDKSGSGYSSPLSVSLMARLAATLPSPVIVTAKAEKTQREDFYLKSLPTKQAVSLVRYRSRKAKSRLSYRKRYSGSLLLSVQYRMHPSISAFSSAVFYDGLLSTPASLAQNRPFPDFLKAYLPAEDFGVGVRFVNVAGRNNERRGESHISEGSTYSATNSINGASTSYRNEAEATLILDLLKELFKGDKTKDMSLPSSIGVVTPYTSQVALLKSMMAADPDFRSLLANIPVTIEVKSVDAYQGRERDLIIFSAVRSNRQGRLGFLTDWRRMNVALTRAKSGLVVFGDMETLKEGDKHWEAFANWCEGVGCVTNAEQG